VLVVCHHAVVRCIHAYFMGTKLEEVPTKKFHRHIIYELTPGPFGCECREIDPAKTVMNYCVIPMIDEE
jgi:broad specificity phosphatase PhoE